MPQRRHHIELDVALYGGGIAGLWLLNQLLATGHDAALFESRALGGEQTLASQGMIHGGIKYALSGALTDASEQLADSRATGFAASRARGRWICVIPGG